jgi:hypothetical protein
MAFALIEGDWKLVIGKLDASKTAKGDRNHPAALYNLNVDLGEQDNLIDQPVHGERVKRMYAEYRQIVTSNRSTGVK